MGSILDEDRPARAESSRLRDVRRKRCVRAVVEKDDNAVLFSLVEDVRCAENALTGGNAFVLVDDNLHGFLFSGSVVTG
jgi:hypothetical protein